MTLKEILKVTRGRMVSGERKNNEVGKICIDSRNLEKNDIFVAIRGNKTDGNKYINDVIDKASVIITDRSMKTNLKTPIIKVLNAKQAIINIGKYNRKKFIDKPLIAITGSVGKTTTKDLISDIFKARYNILSTKGNRNNELGVAITLSEISEKHDVIILELGMNHRKEIEKLSKLCRPTTAIITNIGTSHIGNLGTQENIFKAKMEVTKYLKKGDLILNGSDFYLNKVKKNRRYSVIKTTQDCINNMRLFDKLFLDIEIDNNDYNIEFNIPNKYLIDNILLAIEVSRIYQIPVNTIIRAINNFKGSEKRLEIIKLNNNITLINDCYNASVESIKSSLSVLSNAKNKKLAIIGDVLELGCYSEKIHKQIEQELKSIDNLDVITVGINTKIIELGKHFNNNEEIKEYLNEIDLDDTTILIKGSNAMHMDEIKIFFVKKYVTNIKAL